MVNYFKFSEDKDKDKYTYTNKKPHYFEFGDNNPKHTYRSRTDPYYQTDDYETIKGSLKAQYDDYYGTTKTRGVDFDIIAKKNKAKTPSAIDKEITSIGTDINHGVEDLVQDVGKGVKTVYDDVIKKPIRKIEEIAEDAVKGIETLGKDVITGFETIGDDISMGVVDIEKAGKWIINEGEIIGKDGFKILRWSFDGALWIIEHPRLVAFVGGSYLALRYYNEFKSAI